MLRVIRGWRAGGRKSGRAKEHSEGKSGRVGGSERKEWVERRVIKG